jgi:hypothetical protein
MVWIPQIVRMIGDPHMNRRISSAAGARVAIPAGSVIFFWTTADARNEVTAVGPYAVSAYGSTKNRSSTDASENRAREDETSRFIGSSLPIGG